MRSHVTRSLTKPSAPCWTAARTRATASASTTGCSLVLMRGTLRRRRSQPSTSVGAMRLATVNLLGGRSIAHGEVVENELREAAAMVAADVVALQEVDRAQPRSHGVDQTAVFAEALGAEHWRFLPTLHGTPGEAWTPASGDGSG